MISGATRILFLFGAVGTLAGCRSTLVFIKGAMDYHQGVPDLCLERRASEALAAIDMGWQAEADRGYRWADSGAQVYPHACPAAAELVLTFMSLRRPCGID